MYDARENTVKAIAKTLGVSQKSSSRHLQPQTASSPSAHNRRLRMAAGSSACWLVRLMRTLIDEAQSSGPEPTLRPTLSTSTR